MSDIESNKLEHSNEGSSVLNQFYGTRVILYVEGDDDIPFWNELFKRYAPVKFFTLEQTHGKEGLKRYIKGIKDGTIHNVMVACDSDYADFEEDFISHPLIVTTYGHSIENTMFCIPMMSAYLSRLKATTENLIEHVSLWISEFESQGKELLVFDILNDLKPRGNCCKCLTLGFPRFSIGDGHFDNTKISNFVKEASEIYNLSERKQIEGKIITSDKPIFKIIQGHFLEGAVNEFLRKNASCPLSRKAIYAEFSCCRDLCKKSCKDIEFIKTEINNAVEYIHRH